MKYNIPGRYLGYQSFLTCQSSVITGMNEGFLRQTGYSEGEIINRHIDDVLTDLLRIPQDQVRRIRARGRAVCYLFTRELHPRRVCIRIVNDGDSERSVYYFKDRPASLLDEQLLPLGQLTHHDDVGCALYTVPDLVLLKASPNYLVYLPGPANKAVHCIGKPVGHIIPDFEGSVHESVWNAVMETGKIKYFKECRREPDSRVTYWDCCVIPVIRNRKVRHILEVICKVTDRVANLQLTREQVDHLVKDQQFKTELLESISMGFVSLDQDWRLTYMNRQAASLLDVDPTKLLGQVIWDCLKFLDKAELEKHLRRVMQDSRPFSFEYYYPAGDQYYNCSVHPSDIGITVCWVDTTKHKQAEREALRNKRKADILYEVAEKLHASNQPKRIISQLCMKVAEFLDCQLFINYLVDDKKRKLKLNACWGLDVQAQKMLEWLDFGMSVCGRAARDRCRIVVENIQHTTQYETDLVRSVGIRAYACHPLIEKERVVGTLAFGSRDKDTFSQDDLALMKAVADLMAIAINRARTERVMKEQHQRMLESERERIAALKKSIQMKDEFLSIISHEFKTPLAVIFSAIQTMERTCCSELSDKARGFIDKIRQNSLRQLRLVNNLLDITRVNSGQLMHNWNNIDIVSLTKVITESVEVYAQQKNINLAFHSKVKRKIIQMDQEKYERILLNLLSNAIKFTPEGKSVMVGVSMKNRLGSRMVCIEVRDEGMGIPSEKMEAIFERFVQVDSSLTRQAEGVGIGLYLAKKFTESLGGTMTAKSKMGQGSSFSVFFPDTRKSESHRAGTDTIRDDDKLFQTTRVEFSDLDS